MARLSRLPVPKASACLADVQDLLQESREYIILKHLAQNILKLRGRVPLWRRCRRAGMAFKIHGTSFRELKASELYTSLGSLSMLALDNCIFVSRY